MKTTKYIFLPIALISIVVAIIIVTHIVSSHQSTTLQGVVECREYKVASKIPGRIDSIAISEGDKVVKGELLYTISTPELDAKLEQVDAIKAAALALDKQAESGARKQQIAAARNMWQKATIGKDLAEKSYHRINRLYEQGVATAQQRDEAFANFKAMEATQSAAYAEYSLALSGSTKEQKEAAAAGVAQAQGAIEEVKSYIADSRVVSPISGEVSTIAYYPGELVAAGYPVVTILDLSNTWALFNIKETLLPQISIGQSINAYIPALDKEITLRVAHISSQADFAVWNATKTEGSFDIRTFAVKMISTNNDLRPGMSVIINLQNR